MNASPYHPHPDNAQHPDDSNGWETPRPTPRLTFARVAELHDLANRLAPVYSKPPILSAQASPLESDLYHLEFFKARIRLTHPAQPPGHTTKLTGPEATLGTIEHLHHYLLDGTALFGSGPIAVAITRPALLASHDPAGEIDAAIGWLQAFKAAGLNPTTHTNPGQA